MANNYRNFDEIRKELIDQLPALANTFPNERVQFKKDFEEMMELLVFAMIRDTDNFFAYFTIQCTRVIDFSLKAPAAVSFAGVGFNLIFNPVIMLRYNITEMKAIIWHEMEHIIRDHLKRGTNVMWRNVPHIYKNLAMDAALNQHVRGLPDGCYYPETLEKQFNIGPLKKDMEWEYYLQELLKNKDVQDQAEAVKRYMNGNIPEDMKEKMDQAQQQQQKQQGQGEPEDGDGQDKGDQDGEGQGDGEGGDQEGSGQGGQQGQGNGQGKPQQGNGQGGQQPGQDIEWGIDPNSTHESWEDEAENGDTNMDNVDDIVRKMINDANQQSRGTVPSSVQEAIRRLNEPPELPWQTILKREIGRVPVPYKKTVTRLNRRQPDRRDLRGRLKDRHADIIVAIDTSGSVSDKEIEYAMNELFAIVKTTKSKVTIVECDAAIQRIYEAKRASDIDPKVQGRGGEYCASLCSNA